MINFEANGEKVNWYSETELRQIFNAVLSAYAKTNDVNLSIQTALSNLGNLSKINKNGNANMFLNGAGNWSTVSAGTTYTLPAATENALGGVKIGDNITNNNGSISVANASASAKGVLKAYTSTGTATDGTMTQAAIKAELDKKITSETKVANAEKADNATLADSATKLADACFINGFPVDGYFSDVVFCGICNTAANVAEKEVTIQADYRGGGINSKYTLKANTLICVLFTNVNTAENPTLNVNGTGAKPIYLPNNVRGTRLTDAKNQPVLFMNAGSSWRVVNFDFDNFIANFTYDFKWQQISSANLNELVAPGFYFVNSNCSNLPAGIYSSDNYFLIVGGVAGKMNGFQMLFSSFSNKAASTAGNIFYFRSANGTGGVSGFTDNQPWFKVSGTAVEFK